MKIRVNEHNVYEGKEIPTKERDREEEERERKDRREGRRKV